MDDARRRLGAADDPVRRAQQLFASILESQAEPRPRVRRASGGEPPAPPYAPFPSAKGPAEVEEIMDVARAALAATARLAEVVQLVSAQCDAVAAELADLGSSTEKALTATSERLASLERGLLDEAAPAAAAAEAAVQQLRLRLPRPR